MNPLPSGVEQESSGDDDYGDFAFVSGWGVLGLLVGQKSLGLYALIGVVLLMGIVTKNSILLVDYAIMNQQFGKLMYEATLDWGGAVAADFDEDDRHDSWDGANCPGNWRWESKLAAG